MSNQSAATRNRQPKGLSTGGQFARGTKGESGAAPLSPAAAPEPTDFRSALLYGHAQLTGQGVGHDDATAHLVATASRQLASQYLDHAKTAADRGNEGLALGYIQAHQAASVVRKAAAEHADDPEALAAGVRSAKSSLASTHSLFQGFGPNAVTTVTSEANRFMDDIEGFLEDVRQR